LHDNVRPLSADEALARLREIGVVEGIATFAGLVGWERTRASRAVDAWVQDGKIVCRGQPGRKTQIEAVVTAVPVVQEPVALVARVDARGTLGSIWATPATVTPSSVVAFPVAIGLFAVGLTINVTFAMSYAPQSTWGATIMAMVGAAIEVLALLSPSWGCQLWHRGEYVAAVLAWLLWPGMIAMSLMAATGFSASTIGDVLAHRSRAVFIATSIQDTVQRLADQRRAITETRSVAAIEAQLEIDRPLVARDVWRATKECHDVTIPDSAKACSAIMANRQALATARHRDVLDAQLLAASAVLNGAAITTSVDPQSEQVSKLLSWVTRGWIAPTPDDIAVVRLLGLTIVPSLAGVVLMFAQLLAPTRPTAPSSRG
jgi:hypothetical protein